MRTLAVGMVLVLVASACGGGSDTAASATITTAAPPTTTRVSTTTTQPLGPGSWPNQDSLDRIGVSHGLDDLFIERVRQYTSPVFHNEISDHQFFVMARNVCGMLYAGGPNRLGGEMTLQRVELTARAFNSVFLATSMMIVAYCDEFLDEFHNWMQGAGIVDEQLEVIEY
jgi:hypothetical protein